MSCQLHCITSAPIEYQLPEYDLYDSFDLVSRGLAIVPLRPSAFKTLADFVFPFPLEPIRTVLSDSVGQTRATAERLVTSGRIPNATMLGTELLKGIHFSMTQLVPKTTFTSQSLDEAMAEARLQFITQLFQGSLSESMSSLKQRFNSLLDLVHQSPADVLCVGHAFFLRLFELYLNEARVFDDLKSLVFAFDPQQRPYEPLGGFSITLVN